MVDLKGQVWKGHMRKGHMWKGRKWKHMRKGHVWKGHIHSFITEIYIALLQGYYSHFICY